ncbi:mechanosensitive ion channel family protein [Bacterioplanoides sp. SCSIO 12839]|uniref:mechanosensitive ion channel family protein n=1 Tax=Bacterioplanoides sp. SCSIO 12839 TaxID=2829569 RepID=UPI00210316C2|nr:mechanosensitive ion channel domain-containing protein [Bacterioplanoides sp. SCSIO 12839]UTW49594.1 mechanosensitive ion channel [Bacterioplanoides sp. SCSIO 12839]
MDNINETINNMYQQAAGIGVEYGGKLLSAILVLVIGIWIINKLTRLVSNQSQKALPDETLAKFLSNIFEVVLKVLLVISAASMVGIETTSFVAVLGAAGLAVGLALQGSLSNFAGGVMVLIFRPFKVGDYVEAQGVEGVIQDIGIFVTTFETFDKRILIIPNGPLANGNIINHTKSDVRAVEIPIGIAYSDNIPDAKLALEAVLKNDARVLQDQDNVVAVVDLGSSSVDFLVRAFVKTEDYWSLFFDIRPLLKDAVEQAGCSIPFPQRDVHLFQESA